ncbi:hypothetical protein M6B38_305550 [Iris pallida]|uniref:Uncharacterized protein n=1 Tax=Iris pallida TaxID=29817 RepID=A0AAX6FHI2_IRIPA|nr:hypothetical protein M6B38_419630 [Iris pallida]KAJ6841635.1 hypothetical protein M6B38_305550 [Iris pallida]
MQLQVGVEMRMNGWVSLPQLTSLTFDELQRTSCDRFSPMIRRSSNQVEGNTTIE